MQTVPLHATRGLVSSPQATSPMHAIPFTQKTRCTRGSVQKAQAFQRNIDLLRALFEQVPSTRSLHVESLTWTHSSHTSRLYTTQAQRETAPWVQDLVQPARALGTTLPPLPDTQDSRTLGDHDSCFIQLDDVCVNLCMWVHMCCGAVHGVLRGACTCVCVMHPYGTLSHGTLHIHYSTPFHIHHPPLYTVDSALQGGGVGPHSTATQHIQWF